MFKRSQWILIFILLLAAALRFFQLDAQSFWNDEGTSARVAERSLSLITAASIGDIHPPLYYYALHFWRGAFGESEFALRGLSAALGVLLVWLIYLLGRALFDESTALAAALVAAFNPFQIYYSQEARSYILLAVWAAASTYFLVQSARQAGRLPYMGYILTAAAGMYTHYAFPFVILVHNLIFVGWLVVQYLQSPISASRLHPASCILQWFALQVVVVVLYLPWLGVALRRLPEWQSPAPAYQLGPALLDTLRWFAFGRTITTANTTLALGVVAVFVLMALLPSRLTSERSSAHVSRLSFLLLAWWLVPVALIFSFGLYKQEYLKFLLVCSPAFCLLVASGSVRAWRTATGLVLFKELGTGAGSPAQFGQGLVALLLVLVGMPTLQSLSNLYLDPVYARDNYRGIAQRIQQDERPGDVILLHAPNQWETFTYYHRDESNVVPLVRFRPVTGQAAANELSQTAARARRLFVLYWAEAEADPNRYVEQWLNANTYKASEDWYGTVRLAVYAVPTAPLTQPQHTLSARFGDAIQLTGYALSTEAVRPGDILELALFWKTRSPVAVRYKVFVHLLDTQDKIAAQVDREPGGGLVPTTIWMPGEVIVDRYGLPLPSSLASGRYRLVIGLYGLDGVRLKVDGGTQDRVNLAEITLTP